MYGLGRLGERAEPGDRAQLIDGRAASSEQGLRAYEDRQRSPRESATLKRFLFEQEIRAAWGVVGARGRQRVDDGGRLLPLKLVDGPDPDLIPETRAQPSLEQPHLRIVRRHDEHIGDAEGTTDAETVGKRSIDEPRDDPLDLCCLFFRTLRVAVVNPAARSGVRHP